jgi:toxin ParE1/3/4
MSAIWRPLAERDLDGLIRYIAQRNVRAALDLDAYIEDVVSLLETNPYLGKITSDAKTRQFPVIPSVKLLYRIRPKLNTIEIIRVIHTRRKYP